MQCHRSCHKCKLIMKAHTAANRSHRSQVRVLPQPLPTTLTGYWDAKPEQLEKLRQLYTDVEDKIEGVEA